MPEPKGKGDTFTLDLLEEVPKEIYESITARIRNDSPAFDFMPISKSWFAQEESAFRRNRLALIAATMLTGGNQFGRVANLPRLFAKTGDLSALRRGQFLRESAARLVKLEGVQLLSLIGDLLRAAEQTDESVRRSTLTHCAHLIFKCPKSSRAGLFDAIFDEVATHPKLVSSLMIQGLFNQVRALPVETRERRFDMISSLASVSRVRGEFPNFRDRVRNAPYLPTPRAIELYNELKSYLKTRTLTQRQRAELISDLSGILHSVPLKERLETTNWIFDQANRVGIDDLVASVHQMGRAASCMPGDEAVAFLENAMRHSKQLPGLHIPIRLLHDALLPGRSDRGRLLEVGLKYARDLERPTVLLRATQSHDFPEADWIAKIHSFFPSEDKISQSDWYVQALNKIRRPYSVPEEELQTVEIL